MRTQKWLVKNIDWDVDKYLQKFTEDCRPADEKWKGGRVTEEEKAGIAEIFGQRQADELAKPQNAPCIAAMPKAFHVYLNEKFILEHMFEGGILGPHANLISEADWKEMVQEEIEYICLEHLAPARAWEIECLGWIDRDEHAINLEVIND